MATTRSNRSRNMKSETIGQIGEKQTAVCPDFIKLKVSTPEMALIMLKQEVSL